MDGAYCAEEHGYNSRLDELHAENLLRKLPRLDGYVARRRELAARYDEKPKHSGLLLPKTRPGNLHAYYLYVVRYPKREQIMQKLAKPDTVVNISHPWPIHTMKGYAFLGGKEGDLPRTEAAAKEIFSLPMYPGLSDVEQDFVCEALLDIIWRDV